MHHHHQQHMRKAIKSKQTHTLKFLLIPMAAFTLLSLLLLFFFFSLSATSRHHHHYNHSNSDINPSSTTIIQNACKASRDPPTCQLSLTQSNHVPPSPTTTQILQAALFLSSQNLLKGRSMLQTLLTQFNGNTNGTNAVNNCLELLRYADYRTNLTANALLTRNQIKHARAWMSAVLVYNYDCWSALKYVNTTSLVAKTMSFFNSSVIGSTSDALAMMVSYDVFGEDTRSWGPVKTERDGFWEKPDPDNSGSGSIGGGGGGVPTDLKADVTVCKGGGGGCDYETVQEAVDAAPESVGLPGKRFVIRVKSGVYEETVRVGLEKRNVVLLGDGMGKTIITGSMSVGQQGTTTYNSATVGVVGDGFMASGLTFKNTAGPVAHQAVAFRSDSDLSIVENCEFLGNQDTLYAHSLRQYYKSCRIQGNVDFIFGNSAAFFQDCLILVAPRQIKPENGENNAVTAHGRIDPAQSTGFVFQNCVINGTDAYMTLYYNKPKVHKNYLGRPWKQYSRTVFIRCTLEALIIPAGWLPWSGDFALDTLYYGEFGNTGTGSNTSGRVSWSSRIPLEHVGSYSVQNFIQGDQWITTS